VLRARRPAGVPVLLSSDDLGRWRARRDTVTVLHRGVVPSDGTLAQMRARAPHPRCGCHQRRRPAAALAVGPGRAPPPTANLEIRAAPDAWTGTCRRWPGTTSRYGRWSRGARPLEELFVAAHRRHPATTGAAAA